MGDIKMQEWFDILKISETKDKNIIEKAYIKCIQDDPEHKELYENARDYLLYRLEILKYESVISQFKKEVTNQDFSSMYYRVKEVVKSQEFQMYKNEQEFQNCIAAFINTSFTKKTMRLLLQEFPLHQLEQGSQLYAVLYQYKKEYYKVTLLDKITVIVGLICAFLHVQWEMIDIAGFYMAVVFIYCLLLYIRKKCYVSDTIVIIRNLLLILFVAVASVNFENVGVKLGKKSFDVKAVETTFAKSYNKAKIIDRKMYIYDFSKVSYQVYDNHLEHVDEIKMEYDFRGAYDDMIYFDDQYYYTVKNDNNEFIIRRNIENQVYEVYKEKQEKDQKYISRFYKDGKDCYLVVVKDYYLEVYLLKDNRYQRLIERDLEYNIDLNDMNLRNGYLFFMNEERKNVYGYDLYNDEILEFIYTQGENNYINGFVLDDFHIVVAGSDYNIYVFSLQDEKEQDKYIKRVRGDSMAFFDSQRILFIDEKTLSIYDIEDLKYENSVDLQSITTPVKDCFLFGQYVILYDGSYYSAIEILLKE